MYLDLLILPLLIINFVMVNFIAIINSCQVKQYKRRHHFNSTIKSIMKLSMQIVNGSLVEGCSERGHCRVTVGPISLFWRLTMHWIFIGKQLFKTNLNINIDLNILFEYLNRKTIFRLIYKTAQNLLSILLPKVLTLNVVRIMLLIIDKVNNELEYSLSVNPKIVFWNAI